MMLTLVEVLAAWMPTLASASNGDAPAWLLATGPAAAGGVYYGFWRYYRNTGASHSFERETRITSQPIDGAERQVDTITGTRNSSIERGNHSDHRERVQRVDELPPPAT
jgi:hypothetical protein